MGDVTPPDTGADRRTTVSDDGTEIAYWTSGEGQPIVLVHGTTADHTRWEPIRIALEEHLTVYAMDRRGRGESGDADEYALEREFEDVAAVVDSIDEPVILLGHSYGGLCSLEAALRTGNLRKLILYEPPFLVGDHDPFDANVLAEMQALHDDGADEQVLLLFFREIVKVPTKELAALRDAPNWPARVEAVHTILREEQATANYVFDATRFEELATPTLLLTGSESAPFLRDATAAVNDALSDSQLVVFDGHGHAAMNTAPDQFVDEVLAFVSDVQ